MEILFLLVFFTLIIGGIIVFATKADKDRLAREEEEAKVRAERGAQIEEARKNGDTEQVSQLTAELADTANDATPEMDAESDRQLKVILAALRIHEERTWWSRVRIILTAMLIWAVISGFVGGIILSGFIGSMKHSIY